MENINHFSSGIDSIRFVIPARTLAVFLRKKKLYDKIKLPSSNYTIRDFIEQKYHNYKSIDKKYPFDFRYINIFDGNKSLSNSIILLQNTKELHLIAAKNKKKKNYYIQVVFAGLFQPSKDIKKEVYKILKLFLKRFKIYSLDLSADFKDEKNIKDFKNAFELAIKDNSKIKQYKDSLYANNDGSLNEGLYKVILYDKFNKQSNFHKEKIHPDYKHWKRLEISIILKKKFWNFIDDEVVGIKYSLNDSIDILTSIARSLGLANLSGLNLAMLSSQIKLLNDLRLKILFKPFARYFYKKINKKAKKVSIKSYKKINKKAKKFIKNTFFVG